MKTDINNLVRKNILNLKPYSSARDEFEGKEGIFLDANENPFGKLNRYPDPYQTKIKQKLSKLKQIPAKNIFLGNGSDEVIDLVFRIFCEPKKDKVLTFAPTYGMYEVSASINNVELIKLDLDKDFQIDIQTLKLYLSDKNLKIIFICSPNNPTGNTIQNIKYILKNFNGIVFIDEAYIDFCPEKSLIQEIRNYPNLIISETFSKAWGMASARVGIAYASEEIIRFYNHVKPPYNISQLNQNAILKALKIDNIKKIQDNTKLILNQKKWLIKNLNQLKIIENVFPSQSNFILVKTKNANMIYENLIAKQIIIRNRNAIIKGCLRITVGSPEENKTLIKELKNIELAS